MGTYADDLAALIETLNLNQAILAGHSTGGGEVARYIGRHGTKRVAKAVLISAVPPWMLKTPANPGGLPREAFDDIRAKVLADRSQFFKDLSAPFYGANRPGAKVSQPTLIIHGDDDQIVPIGASALHSSKIIKGAALKYIQARRTDCA